MKNLDPHDEEAATHFESQHYPHATPETRRLLLHSRPAIRRFLESGLGLAQPR